MGGGEPPGVANDASGPSLDGERYSSVVPEQRLIFV